MYIMIDLTHNFHDWFTGTGASEAIMKVIGLNPSVWKKKRELCA